MWAHHTAPPAAAIAAPPRARGRTSDECASGCVVARGCVRAVADGRGFGPVLGELGDVGTELAALAAAAAGVAMARATAPAGPGSELAALLAPWTRSAAFETTAWVMSSKRPSRGGALAGWKTAIAYDGRQEAPWAAPERSGEVRA